MGLLDDAATEFMRAVELVPAEPASWANLGLTHVRRGAIDEAAGPLDRAQALAPSSGEVALLQGLVAGTDGRLDEGIAHLRRAVDLRPDGIQARFALAAAIERAGGPDADGQAAQLLEEILARQENLAVRLERARLAAKLADGSALRDSVVRLGERAADWPPVAVEQYGALQREAGADDFGRAATAIAVLRNVLVRVPAFRASLAAVQIPPELIGAPLDRFLALPVVSVVASPPDESLTFSLAPIGTGEAAPASALTALPLGEPGVPAVFAANGRGVRRPGAPGEPVPFPGGALDAPPSGSSLLPLDWNHDFRTDLVLAGAGGLRLLLQGRGRACSPTRAPAGRTARR